MPKLLRLITIIIGLNVVLFCLLRLALWLYFNNPSDPIPNDSLMQAFYVGFKFDLRLALLIILPAFLVAWIKPLSPFQSLTGKILWTGYFALAILLVGLIYVVNFGHFAYLQKPIDSTVLRFLDTPLITSRMVWETYPVIWSTLGITALVLAYVRLLSHLINKLTSTPLLYITKWRKILFATLSTLIIIFGLYGKFSYYPLRWSDAFFSTHPFVSALTSNPALYFFNTFKNRAVKFNIEQVHQHYDRIADYLGVQQPDKARLNFTRTIPPRSQLANKATPNVVMVFLESFAAHKTGLFGNPLDPTPNFDAIARQGLFFNRYYAPHTGTARSVFAAITGIPDIEQVKTSTRNPLVVHQHTIINAFKGYEKLYFLGGSASWGNIRGLLSRNIPGLRLYEEGDYTSPRVDVWGIADHHLFEEANQVMRTIQDKPFFAIIQTSGNHRPYTIPKDNHGFQIQKYNKKIILRSGFISEGEFNAFRFMDHSIGLFINNARKEAYFDNTIFVFFGDHGVGGEGAFISPAERQLELTHLHVPLVIYAPKLFPQARVLSNVAGEVDILPTIASLAGIAYKNTTTGRDLLDPRFDKQRYAFIIRGYQPPQTVGVIDDQYYFIMKADGSQKTLHSLNSETPREDVSLQFPDQAAKLEQLTLGLYETIRYMRYHNRQP